LTTPYPYELRLPVTFRDIDVLGHINNAVYVTWFEAARTSYLMELCSLKRLEDLPVILAETTCRYIAQGEWGETVVIGCGVSRWGSKSFDLAYRVATTTGRVLAAGRSVQVYYDYETRQTVAIPQQFRTLVAGRQGGWTPPADL
jgi:acyl-CoA thioester hydrolase